MNRGLVVESGAQLKIKVEMNAYETSPAQPLHHLVHQVDSPWWSGQAEVQTFTGPKLVATKVRALHQRRKGRDLFDLWLALTGLDLDPAEIHAAIEPYRPDGYTMATATRRSPSTSPTCGSATTSTPS